jgi:hypothetical protein
MRKRDEPEACDHCRCVDPTVHESRNSDGDPALLCNGCEEVEDNARCRREAEPEFYREDRP